ncbi:uncharacterized protein mslnb [Archocentrus centrarchus]|uniref:uncharacterized protein mslnb n=1 Tax=Archocentrus centrarchus TaxID=63155 RepID=UPI0011E9D861|nr:uncharacterized protein LOC115789484 [Archocentrus centrarchus]
MSRGHLIAVFVSTVGSDFHHNTLTAHETGCIMKTLCLFLLVYLQGSFFVEPSSAQSNAVCTKETCVQVPDATSNFLQCVGLSPTDTGEDHLRRLKGILEATMDLYTFMKSSMTRGTILSVDGALELDLAADPLQNEDLVRMWMEVKMKPLLKTITKGFLSCLSTKNFSCSTYQTVVEELSNYYSEMEPVRQKWIYTFFMYPFLSSERVAGCVNPDESSKEWLMKNFGAFGVLARLRDFSALNMVFSGLEALDLLSPAQKAELLMSPEVASLDNGTLSLVFHSLLTGGSGPSPTAEPGWDSSWTTPGYPPSYPLQPSYNPQPGLQQVVNGVMAAFKPIGSFVQGFVSFTRERNVSNIKSTTMTQFLLNWTLAELADMYRQPNTSVAPEEPWFDVTNVGAWYEHVVKPLLRRFLPNEELLMHQNITLAFHEVFRLNHGMDNETLAEIQDVCSITLDKSPCGLTDAVANVAQVLHCSARNNLTMTEEVVRQLLLQLTQVLNSLIREFSTTGFTQVVSEFQQIFSESESPSLTREHLSDPQFIQLWFKVKLLPLLPSVQPELLSCLSTKNFSCPVYQTLVAALSKDMSFMNADVMYSHNIYKYFIYPFLLNHNTSDPQCVSSANQSAEWLTVNFGFFSSFAPITDFYALNPYFSGLEALQLLTPRQTAELLLLPLRTPPEKDVVINQVFDFLTQSPAARKYPEVLRALVALAEQESPPCNVYKQIFERLYKAIPSLAPEMEIVTWASIEDLMNIAPDECVPANLTCPLTQLNDSLICSGVNSSDLLSYWNTFKQVSCTFTLEKYACTKLDSFTANDLVSLLMCDLPTNSGHSKMLWKMLLTKVSSVLDPALDILAGMSMPVVPSASEVLDVIGEIRVSLLTNEQLQNSSVIKLWFSERLRSLLPFASGIFLRCLSSRHLTCQSYQKILQVFSDQSKYMTIKEQHMVLQDFILRFLTQPHSNSSCVATSNSTAQWQEENLGPFSAFLSLTELLQLNPQYNPMEVLTLLTPKQSAELLVLRLPILPDKDVIINALFDYLTESADETKFIEFLTNLTVFIYPENFTCSSYKTLFTRLDSATPVVSLKVAIVITQTKLALSQHLPPDCIIYGGQCNTVMANMTEICGEVNSSAIQHYLASGQMSGPLCDFTVKEIACASLSALTAEQLAMILKCNRSSNSSGSRPAWKLLLTKASQVLDQALDQLANTTLDPRSPAVSMILDIIQELTINTVNTTTINNPTFIQTWFGHRLNPFLPAVSPDFLSCLTTRELTCRSYQEILQILSHLQPQMTRTRRMSVYTHFIKVFLTRNNSADPACSSGIATSVEWIQINLGGFSEFASIKDIGMIYPKFSVMEALSQLTVRQLAEVAVIPGQLTSSEQVYMVMSYVPDQLLPAFFDDFSPVIMGQENAFPLVVRSTMLQVVFDRANLSKHSVDDSVVLIWLQHRLPPLLVQLSPVHVAPYFSILAGRSCSTEHVGVQNLNMTITTLSEETQKEIYDHIIQTLRGSEPLRCYGDNYNRSFYKFLESSFMEFQFPNLTTFLSLIPHDRFQLLINSMPPSDLGNFLRRPHVVDNDAELCELYNNYREMPQFLQTETLPEVVRRPTLPCVWPMALSSTQRSDVNAWFDLRLKNYLAFLTKDLISPGVTYNASCLAFQKLVSVLGVYNYTNADFMRSDVFSTIRTYLYIGTDANPRCYIASDPELNSTAWFAEYIGPFMSFLTLDDLLTFGSQTVIQVFTVNPLNIALLNHSVIPENLTTYYTELIYEQDSNFNPLLLPLLCRCIAPGPAYTQLSPEETMIVLMNLTDLCTDLDPQISAALAGNFGDRIDAHIIAALGNESSGMSINQIQSIKPEDLRAALGILASVIDWNEGQARAIIQLLLSSGMIQLNSSSSLIALGTLIMGVSVKEFEQINSSLLLEAFKNPSLVQNLLSGPEIIQESVVTQIISVNSNNEKVIENVPDDLGTKIPRPLLVDFSSSNFVVTNLNKKKWIQQQAELFFSVITVESATAQLGGPDNLSSSVLQGFTCTGVRAISIVQIKKLIRACRRTGSNKVTLVETQLTCMYNYIKGDGNTTVFSLYPPDVLLYYNYSLVPQASCRSYLTELGDADFSVFSPALSYIRTALFENAKRCLGITNTSLTADNISVLGNMCCILDGSYIQNSDPSILEKLKGCSDLTDAQAVAAQTLLINGKTKYGAPSKWTVQTLKDLGMLPLYLTSTFYDYFDQKRKREFMKYFLAILRKNKVSRQKIKKLKREMAISVRNKLKQSPATDCTVGFITRVTISSEAFPLDYSDINQFNICLNATIVRDNLDAITQKLDQDDYLKIVLSKLRQAYSPSSIPENQVQVLSMASRVATVEDISMWTITEIDTLAALMDPINGMWDPSLARAIITKYLSIKGNSLGTAEINTIGGPNLCSLDVQVLKNISQESLKMAKKLDMSNCTADQKKELFSIALKSFTQRTRSTTVPVSTYQLIQPYLSGADLAFVQSLVSANVSMDLTTFTGLLENVIMNLTVADVQGLLGANLPTLKLYENVPVVQNWISNQYQSDLNRLGVDITGGKADPITSPTVSTSTGTNVSTSTSTTVSTSTGKTVSTSTGPTASTSTGSTSGTSSTTKSMTTSAIISTTKSSGSSSTLRGTGFSFLVLLVLLIAAQHVLM